MSAPTTERHGALGQRAASGPDQGRQEKRSAQASRIQQWTAGLSQIDPANRETTEGPGQADCLQQGEGTDVGQQPTDLSPAMVCIVVVRSRRRYQGRRGH